MHSAAVLLLGGLITTGVSHGPGSGVASPIVSCNAQGGVYDSVWVNNFNNQSAAQIVVNGTVLWTASPTATLNEIGFLPMCDIDTDDTSKTSPNWAVVWSAHVTVGSAAYDYAYCSVNGHTPFQVGIYQGVNPPSPQTANNAWVALRRTSGSYNGQSVIVVAVAFNEFIVPRQDCAVYGQVFYVNPSTGQPIASTSPMVLNGYSPSAPHGIREPGDCAIGGIAGDDYGNFVVTYVRQYQVGYSNGVGTYASTITASATPGVIEMELSNDSGQSAQYTWSRVACYHGTSSTSGGFVVAGNGGNSYVNAWRCTTNWTNTATMVASNFTDGGGTTYPFPSNSGDNWEFDIACERDTPGNYIITWVTTEYTSGYGNEGANNVAYQAFRADVAQTLTMLTSYYGSGNNAPPDWGDMPSVAVCDKIDNGVAQIDWIETNSTTSVGTLQTQLVSGP